MPDYTSDSFLISFRIFFSPLQREINKTSFCKLCSFFYLFVVSLDQVRATWYVSSIFNHLSNPFYFVFVISLPIYTALDLTAWNKSLVLLNNFHFSSLSFNTAVTQTTLKNYIAFAIWKLIELIIIVFLASIPIPWM